MSELPATRGAIAVRSAAFGHEEALPERFHDVSPPLEWAPGPDGVVEYAVTCVDRTDPPGSTAHWVLAGIPAGTTTLAEGAVPEGVVVGRNDFGADGWTGPEAGQAYRYFFDVVALDRHLEVEPGVGVHELWSAIGEHALATGTLVAQNRRKESHA